MIKIYDGRSDFYQWDLNRKLIISDPTVTQIHFCNKTSNCSLVVEVKDGLADVPNILLQTDWPIYVYAYCGECFTKESAVFKVNKRSKPEGYVYTETEIKSIEHYVEEALKAANFAPLVDGKVPAKNLPSYIDDVVNGTMDDYGFHIKNSGESAFDEIDNDGYIINPRRGVLYISDEGNGNSPRVYRWSGTAFVEIVGGSDIPAPEGNGFLRAYNGTYGFDYGYLLPDAPDLDGKIMRHLNGYWQPVDFAGGAADLSEYAKITYVDGKIGDIDAALDELHAYAQSWVYDAGGSAE